MTTRSKPVSGEDVAAKIQYAKDSGRAYVILSRAEHHAFIMHEVNRTQGAHIGMNPFSVAAGLARGEADAMRAMPGSADDYPGMVGCYNGVVIVVDREAMPSDPKPTLCARYYALRDACEAMLKATEERAPVEDAWQRTITIDQSNEIVRAHAALADLLPRRTT